MSKIDHTFQSLCREILHNGREYENKNRGVKRLQIPSYTLRHSFSDGFPAITNKKLYWKGIVTELLWFLRGDNDVEFLNKHGVNIWNKDAYNWYVKEFKNNDPITEETEQFYVKNSDGSYRMFTFEEFSEIGKGSVGRNYSVQWTDFQGVNQIKRLIEDMSSDIMSSRLKVNAWNPAEIFDTALPPCHSEFQVIGVPIGPDKFGFELHWNQRSVDTFLGLPFNIASYGLLAYILEIVTGHKALGIEGTLKCVHFYDNQYEAVKQLLKRDPDTHPNCGLSLPSPLRIEEESSFEYLLRILEHEGPSSYKLVGYSSDENIQVEMLAPKTL